MTGTHSAKEMGHMPVCVDWHSLQGFQGQLFKILPDIPKVDHHIGYNVYSLSLNYAHFLKKSRLEEDYFSLGVIFCNI